MATSNTDNPYDILGVDRNASLDEVKKAYRKKARENHPDLHPNDPDANKRMNQINEAYDRITNPSKYAKEDARRAAASDPATNPFAGYGGAGASGGGRYGPGTAGGPYGTGSAGGSPYGTGPGPGAGNPYGGGRSGPTGQGQWTTDDWTTFTWDDLFGGGWGNTTTFSTHPEPSASDSPEFIRAINLINGNNPREALKILQAIPSTGRTARWYYLSSLANQAAGNSLRAHEHMQRARQLDPANPDYQRAAASFTQQATDYEQEGQTRGFSSRILDPSTLCCCLCWSTMLCQPFLICL